MKQKDLVTEIKLHKIGECPICHKGQMVKGSAGWTCDHFRSLVDKCDFTIFASYQGYELTEEDANRLISKGESEPRLFHTLSGKPFIAKMRLVNNKVKVLGENSILHSPCPRCGGKIKETQKGYACENLFKEGVGHCDMYIPKMICSHTISRNEAELLIQKGRTEPIDGFEAKGKVFTSCLVLRDGAVVMDGRICECPKCGGVIYAGTKAYNCGNFRDPNIRCDFVVWRNMYGRDITVEDVKTLCENKITPLLKFKTKAGDEINRSLFLNDDNKVKLV